MDAAKNRQMEPKVGVHGVAAGIDFGLDGLERGLDLQEVFACATLGGEAGGFDLHAYPQFEDLQHVLCRLHFVRIDAERPALHVRRHERAKPLARHHQAVRSERRNGLAHHRAADAGREGEFLFGRQARARLQASAEDLGGKPLSQLLGPIERRAKRERDRLAFLHGSCRSMPHLTTIARFPCPTRPTAEISTAFRACRRRLLGRPPPEFARRPGRLDGAPNNISHIRSSYESACRPAAGDICCASGGLLAA